MAAGWITKIKYLLQVTLTRSVVVVVEQVPDFRVPAVQWGNELRQVEQGFSSFFTKFLPYLMIFQSGVHRTLKNHQIWQKFGKKWRNPVPSLNVIENVWNIEFYSYQILFYYRNGLYDIHTIFKNYLLIQFKAQVNLIELLRNSSYMSRC